RVITPAPHASCVRQHDAAHDGEPRLAVVEHLSVDRDLVGFPDNRTGRQELGKHYPADMLRYSNGLGAIPMLQGRAGTFRADARGPSLIPRHTTSHDARELTA